MQLSYDLLVSCPVARLPRRPSVPRVVGSRGYGRGNKLDSNRWTFAKLDEPHGPDLLPTPSAVTRIEGRSYAHFLAGRGDSSASGEDV